MPINKHLQLRLYPDKIESLLKHKNQIPYPQKVVLNTCHTYYPKLKKKPLNCIIILTVLHEFPSCPKWVTENKLELFSQCDEGGGFDKNAHFLP